MSEKIDYEVLRKLLDEGAQLVEVLPREEYAEEHPPGAINIPLKELDRDSATQLDRELPVIVYCWDRLCDMRPRAAALLDRLGFERVYDYAASKVDYLARGLPREGEKASEGRAVDSLRKDVVRSFIVASCTPCERSSTSSLDGQRVAVMRRRSSSRSSCGTSMLKGRITPSWAAEDSICGS
jgi:rhodanese-related sulfurtransferase